MAGSVTAFVYGSEEAEPESGFAKATKSREKLTTNNKRLAEQIQKVLGNAISGVMEGQEHDRDARREEVHPLSRRRPAAHAGRSGAFPIADSELGIAR